MTPDIFLRTALAAGIILMGLGAYWLSNQWMLLRARSYSSALITQPNGPAIVYFTTPDCAPCKTIQHPAIEKVRGILGEKLQVVEIDATQQAELAQHWGVMGVPTTFIIDSHGKPRFVNNGVARADKLLKQLQSI